MSDSNQSSKGVLQLYMTDFCPFAHRAWLALLEKEQNPEEPKLFNYIEVNFYNPSLPLTQEFLSIHNTVPCGTLDGRVLKESMPMCYFVDEELVPDRNPLQPADEEGKKKMKNLIEKFTSGEFDIVGPMYRVLTAQLPEEKEALEEHSKALLHAYAELARVLKESGGPYLMGSQFTLADIALTPFLERAFVVLPHYKAFTIPDEATYGALHAYRRAYLQRPSFRITEADRLPRSVAVQPYAETDRLKYTLEVNASMAHGVKDQVRRQLRNAPPGKATVNIEAAKAERDAERTAAAKPQ